MKLTKSKLKEIIKEELLGEQQITLRSMYDELGYKLNRGPFFYLSECVVNYTFETFIILIIRRL